MIYEGYVSRKFPVEIQQVARRKLKMLNNAQNLHDLTLPRSNRLEALHGKRLGQFSIRINRQYIIGIHAIKEMISVSKSRVKLILLDAQDRQDEIIVSTERSPVFKKWLTGEF